jgi:hypothetical protein
MILDPESRIQGSKKSRISDPQHCSFDYFFYFSLFRTGGFRVRAEIWVLDPVSQFQRGEKKLLI